MEEISGLLQKIVTVSTSEGKSYTGVLVGLDSHTLNVCLSEVKDESGHVIHRLLLNGGKVTQIFSSEKPFDLQALADRLERVFPRMVRVNGGAGIIVVMDRIRVSERGILEGSGPAAERVQKVYEEFVRTTAQPSV
jgi:small nuclear ribonucleoprotein (snRNP)-like protein